MMKEKRLTIDQETFSFHNKQIFQKVIHHPIVQSAKIIGCYVSLPQEVQTTQIILELLKSHRVCVPKVEGSEMSFYEIHSLDDLKEGHFHVLEPVTSTLIEVCDIDFMIVPMLAYDQKRYRVGYGKGYYDKYFARGYTGYKLGLAFSFQYVEKIDVDENDIALDEIITEELSSLFIEINCEM